jgi:hypothetical protein
MTSWNRGKENEERGERELSDNNPDNNLKGVSDKVGGEIEQGIDNVGDTLSGKQRDLEGHVQNEGARADDAVTDAGDRMGDAAKDAGQWMENRGKEAKEWTEDRGDEIRDATT